MEPADRRRREEALDWARRIQDPSFHDWDGHVAWLESDPRNGAAFDDVALLIDDAVEGLAPSTEMPSTAVANDNHGDVSLRGRRRHPWRWATGLGIAAAAGIAGVVALPSLMPGGSASYLVRTAPGESRQIVLVDGTHVALNGDTMLRLDRKDARTAAIERGEAFFSVVHDAARPFRVQAGDAVFQDVGTAFDVTREDGRTEVAVKEGAVMYDPGHTAVRLDKGQAITIGADSATIRQIDAAAAGGWREGRLSYRDAPLSEVASDLARSIGHPVSIDRALAGRRFTGMLIVDADRPRMFRRIGAVMDVSVRRDGAGWRLMPLGK